MRVKNNGEMQTNGPFKTTACTHVDNLALGYTHPPEQQADTTTMRPRDVDGSPMEVVARPTLSPWDQTINYTGNELPTSFSRASCWNLLKMSSLWLEGRETKARELSWFACWLLTGDLCSCVDVAALTSRTRWIVVRVVDFLFDCQSSGWFLSDSELQIFIFRSEKRNGLLMQYFDLHERVFFLLEKSVWPKSEAQNRIRIKITLNFMILAIGYKSCFFSVLCKKGRGLVWTRHHSAPCFFASIFDLPLRFCLDIP